MPNQASVSAPHTVQGDLPMLQDGQFQSPMSESVEQHNRLLVGPVLGSSKLFSICLLLVLVFGFFPYFFAAQLSRS